MMSRKTRQGMLVLSVLSVLSFWAARDRDTELGRPFADLDTRLDYALQDFQLHYFDMQGLPAVILRSPKLNNDAATGIGTVFKPELEVFHEGLLWNIEADSGTVSSSQDQVFLGGHVTIRRSGQQPGDTLRIVTDDVLLYVEPRVASSDAAVEMVDAFSRLQAEGFTIDMINNTYQLNHNVTGAYGIQ